MNTFLKQRVAVSVAMILVFSAVNADQGKHGKKEHKDSIVGTWNLRLRAEDVVTNGTQANEETTEETNGSFIEAVATFHDDCTVLLTTASGPHGGEEESNSIFSAFPTTSHGVWCKTGKGCIEVILSSVNNNNRRIGEETPPTRSRGKLCLKVVLVDCGEKIVVSGRLSFHPLHDICFERQRNRSWNFIGRGCKLSICDCEPKRQIAQ